MDWIHVYSMNAYLLKLNCIIFNYQPFATINQHLSTCQSVHQHFVKAISCQIIRGERWYIRRRFPLRLATGMQVTSFTIITRTSEFLIRLGRTHKLCLCRDILRVRRKSEIALHKNNECVLQPRLIKHELVLVFIPYYP